MEVLIWKMEAIAGDDEPWPPVFSFARIVFTGSLSKSSHYGRGASWGKRREEESDIGQGVPTVAGIGDRIIAEPAAAGFL